MKSVMRLLILMASFSVLGCGGGPGDGEVPTGTPPAAADPGEAPKAPAPEM